MAVRIYFEIGHEASIRNKKTQEGFTHDWEVFVRGCDGAEIHYFVEKVVFYLHETFPKPKRVVKEPPYSVKESGYAGFNLPIDIYLRNNNEPKKIRFNYDLHLQNAGPPINKVQREKYIFTSTTDDFKSRLLKGGGTIGSLPKVQEFDDSRTSVDDKNQMTNKPKLSGCDIRKQKTGEPSREFNAIFGSPIFTSKTNVDKQQQSKSEAKIVDKSRMKHSPQKDSHRDKEKSKDRTDSDKKNKDDKKQKEKSKDRERSKDKILKKERSPRPKSPSPRGSPKHSPTRYSSPTIRHKDVKSHEKRDKQDEKKQKKEKRSKEHKESKHSDEQKVSISGTIDKHKENIIKNDKKELGKVKVENPPSPPPKVDKKEKAKEKTIVKDIIKEEKSFSDKSYSEKYKYKKKDKEKREKKEEKSHKSEKKLEKTQSTLDSKANLFKAEAPPVTIKKEKLFSNPVTIDESSSSSTSSSNSSTIAERPPEKKIKIEPKPIKEEKNLKSNKKEKNYEDTAIKCKRKGNPLEAKDQPPEKVHKDNINNNSDGDQEVPSKLYLTSSHETEEDYFGVLRDLQQKIMGLKDNSDLQKVVQLIAETGRYEVSAHTFDFDLCLLDRSTVKQLQEFFTNET